MTDKQHPEEHPVNDIGDDHVLAHDVDEEPVEANRRLFEGGMLKFVTLLAIAYSSIHLYSLNIAPLETWSFRIVHIAGALVLGFRQGSDLLRLCEQWIGIQHLPRLRA